MSLDFILLQTLKTSYLRIAKKNRLRRFTQFVVLVFMVTQNRLKVIWSAKSISKNLISHAKLTLVVHL